MALDLGSLSSKKQRPLECFLLLDSIRLSE